ncbi:MAG: Rpn family recombination-promoting nuclease/putative transposase [Leptolyngbyaceae cyanobacterium RM1_405_57]|nr:Rpn family recombination-promoting nuclease/putative transposase [Leptolyngbyaceae cyanobacterium RM1_405_57]
MKTDSLFYRLFQRSPSIFFELIGQTASEASNYEFRSVEIKQTAFRIDGVLLSTGTADRPVYFSEVQFQKDPYLYHRFFAELFLYIDQHPTTHDWQGILIYPSRNLEPDQTRLHQTLLDSPKVRRIYLNELGEAASLPLGLGLVKLIIEPEATAPEQARQLIRRSQQENIGGISDQEIIDLIETIIVYKFTSLNWREIRTMLGLDLIKHTRAYQEAVEEGRQEGRQEGRYK